MKRDIIESNEYKNAREFLIEKFKKLNKDKLLKLEKYIQDDKDATGII